MQSSVEGRGGTRENKSQDCVLETRAEQMELRKGNQDPAVMGIIIVGIRTIAVKILEEVSMGMDRLREFWVVSLKIKFQ